MNKSTSVVVAAMIVLFAAWIFWQLKTPTTPAEQHVARPPTDQPAAHRDPRFVGKLPAQFVVVRLLNEEIAYVRDQNGACFLTYITWGGGSAEHMNTEFAAAPERACRAPSAAVEGDGQ